MLTSIMYLILFWVMSCIVECMYYATDKKWVRIVGNITAIAIVFGVFFIHIQRLEKKATYQEVTVCGIVPEKYTGITSDGEILLFDKKIPTETLKEIKESYPIDGKNDDDLLDICYFNIVEKY